MEESKLVVIVSTAVLSLYTHVFPSRMYLVYTHKTTYACMYMYLHKNKHTCSKIDP